MDTKNNRAEKRLRFGSQHPHGSSQLSITPVPWDPMPSSEGTRYTHGTQTYIQVITHTHKIKKNFKKSNRKHSKEQKKYKRPINTGCDV